MAYKSALFLLIVYVRLQVSIISFLQNVLRSHLGLEITHENGEEKEEEHEEDLRFSLMLFE